MFTYIGNCRFCCRETSWEKKSFCFGLCPYFFMFMYTFTYLLNVNKCVLVLISFLLFITLIFVLISLNFLLLLFRISILSFGFIFRFDGSNKTYFIWIFFLVSLYWCRYVNIILQMTEANHRSYIGIDAIVQTCSKVYPDQLNPTQAASVVKYWYIYIKYNKIWLDERFIDL